MFAPPAQLTNRGVFANCRLAGMSKACGSKARRGCEPQRTASHGRNPPKVAPEAGGTVRLKEGVARGEKTSPAMLVLHALDLAQVWYEVPA